MRARAGLCVYIYIGVCIYIPIKTHTNGQMASVDKTHIFTHVACECVKVSDLFTVTAPSPRLQLLFTLSPSKINIP